MTITTADAKEYASPHQTLTLTSDKDASEHIDLNTVEGNIRTTTNSVLQENIMATIATIMNAMRANAQTRTIAVKNIKNAIKLSVLRGTTTITITEQTSKVDPTTEHARVASKLKARHSVLMDNDHKSHRRAKSKLQMRVLHTYL